MASRDTDTRLADCIAEFYADPLGYVMFCFPWADDPLIQQVHMPEEYQDRFDSEFGPDRWACEFLDELGAQIRIRGFNGHDPVLPIQFCTKSGHGIGKTAMTAWLVKFILDTRPLSKGTVTANTAEQLRTKTWAEVGKWHKMSLTRHWFDYSSGRGSMSMRHRQYPETWRCEAHTCREENSEAFAGQHAANSTSFYIFDEASAVPTKIFEVRQGGLTEGEPMTFDWGNPTRNTGAFFENCQGRFRERYIVRSIDSRNVAITNKELLRQWGHDYGEDSDFFKVRVMGEFPSLGEMQFIPTDTVTLAMERELTEDPHAPLIIGVDVGRFGPDESVIFSRIGNDARSFPPKRFPAITTDALYDRIVDEVNFFTGLGREVGGLFIDATGIGGPLCDFLDRAGYDPIQVNFGLTAHNSNMYRYVSDEIWGKMRSGLNTLCLPRENTQAGADLKADLTQRQFGYTVQGNRIHLEAKRDMKVRGIASPDLADALAVTFYRGVDRLKMPAGLKDAGQSVNSDYDPLDSKWAEK